MASPERVIIFIGQILGAPRTGRHHDYAMLKEEFPPQHKWFEELKLRVDLGYQGIKTDYGGSDIEIPYKKPRKSKRHPNPQLSKEHKAYNRAVSKARSYVENAICGMNPWERPRMKRFRILVNAFRNRLDGFANAVIGVCVGLWNALIC